MHAVSGNWEGSLLRIIRGRDDEYHVELYT